MYEARLAAAKSELVTLEKRLKVVIEKTASIDEVSPSRHITIRVGKTKNASLFHTLLCSPVTEY